MGQHFGYDDHAHPVHEWRLLKSHCCLRKRKRERGLKRSRGNEREKRRGKERERESLREETAW